MTVVWDDEQPLDHAGAPVAPSRRPAGRTGTASASRAGPGRGLYAVDADQVLATVIDDYPARPPRTRLLRR